MEIADRIALACLGLLAPLAAAARNCDWSDPGANPYLGNRATAVAHYKHMPAEIRDVLAARVAGRRHQHIATATADGITDTDGNRYDDLRLMYFGRNSLCHTVTRLDWPRDLVVRGLVYTEQGHTVIVWTACGNPSVATLVQGAVVAGPTLPAAAPRARQVLRAVVVQQVTEPPIWWLVAAALLAMCGVRSARLGKLTKADQETRWSK